MNESHESKKKSTAILVPRILTETAVSTRRFSSYSATATDADTNAPLSDYWRAVSKRLWLVLGITVMVTTLAAVYMARKPDIYEAQVRVEVNLENVTAGLGSAKNNSVVVSGPISEPAYFNTQLQLLTGPGLLRRVVKSLDLEHDEAFLGPQPAHGSSSWLKPLDSLLGNGGETGSKGNDRAGIESALKSGVASATSRADLAEAKRLAPYVDALRKNLKVEPVREARLAIKDTRLIDVNFKHADPQIAARVVNAVADAFVLTNNERKLETNTATGSFLQKRVVELKEEIRNSEERLINYAQNHQILSLDANQNTVTERLTGLNRQLLEAENERSLAEAAYRAALAPGAARALAADVTKQLAEAETKLADLQQRRAQLLVEYYEEWPAVKEVNEQIAVLGKYIQDVRDRSTGTVVTNLETRYNQALAREQTLRASFDRQRGETLTQNVAAINYRIIQQEIETNKSLLDGLLQRSKENEVVLAAVPNDVHVVDYAFTPDQPVAPKRSQGVGLAAMLSLTLSIGLALLLEHLDDTVRSTKDVEKMLQLPALAVIPSIGSFTRRRLLPAPGASQSRRGDELDQALLVKADAPSPLAEAYRHLRTSVLLSTSDRAPKTLLVTSSVPAEGKTTTAVNTAAALALTGADVLIIDADMRNQRLHSIFGMDNSQGLSTILSSEISDSEAFTFIKRHEASGIHVLTAGTIPTDPSELLGSPQMRRLLAALASRFTYIIIDSPPAIAFTDSVLLSSMVDGVFLVVHSGKSSPEIVRRSRNMLQDVGAKILGVVLNNVKSQSQGDYSRHYYQSYYNHKAGAGEAASGV